MDPSQSISRGRSGFARTVGTPVAGMASSFLEEVSISDFTSDARVITEAAPPYRIVHVNAAWCTTTGYPSSAFIGNTCKLLQGSETCKRTTQVLHPDQPRSTSTLTVDDTSRTLDDGARRQEHGAQEGPVAQELPVAMPPSSAAPSSSVQTCGGAAMAAAAPPLPPRPPPRRAPLLWIAIGPVIGLFSLLTATGSS